MSNSTNADDVELTDNQRDAFEILHDRPVTKSELAEELACPENTAKYYIEALRKAGVEIENDPATFEYYLPDVHDEPEPEEPEDEGPNEDDDLGPKELELIAELPATPDELSTELGLSENLVNAYIESIEDKGVSVGIDKDFEDDDAEWVFHLPDQPKIRRVATKHTGSKTREANDWATEMEATILRRLKRKDPLVATQAPDPGNEDFVAHLTDAHMGDVVEDERGREVFNPDICEASIEHFTQKALDMKELMEPVSQFDTAHLLWGGDMLTNENIYDGQAFDISMMLGDQMAAAVDALTQQAKSFAEAFDTVQIVAQPGNHGKTRASGVSKQANMDLICYRWIQDRLIEAGYDNINFLEAEATEYRNFELRNGEWRGHLRHGHNSLKHVDSTGASSRDWRGWWAQHSFNIAYRGHFHESRRENVMNQPHVIESPSMKPGDEFAEKIGQPDASTHRKLGTIHGCSDKRPHTWEYVIDDIDMEHAG
ncbi:winged helix-turn-helix domain-containing protein [Halococcus saccharolyticus]|uniref:Uncharacterized protein n=1 Tax=Halococcus saccharolyticus DSM 5350 TaxID=1227455 RepID=M0MQJ3_9EURY|nr:helix-turn-helix domain-containing protein [Halococcus saccharolyticus]EMA47603.1 hypothetical protein C449_01032 [Halococcus saccharolyticus DSM 5350]